MFTEMPVVIAIEETFALAELLAKYRLDLLMVGLVLRYLQHVVDLRHTLAAALGAIMSMEAKKHPAPCHGAFVRHDWRWRTDLIGRFVLKNLATVLKSTKWQWHRSP